MIEAIYEKTINSGTIILLSRFAPERLLRIAKQALVFCIFHHFLSVTNPAVELIPVVSS